jgi:hypothetical protein
MNLETHMTPLARAARALVLKESGTDSFDALEPELQEQVIESVKAVVEALREPDPVMAQAGAEIVRNVHGENGHAAFEGDAANVWRAMIDAVG